MIDVKSLGAVGDGIADDTIPIQQALDAGGAYLSPAKGYRTTKPVLMDGNGVWLVGEGVRSPLVPDFAVGGTPLLTPGYYLSTFFCTVGIVAGTTHARISDIAILGRANAEPTFMGVTMPVRGIVVGVTPAGNDHAAVAWDGHNTIERVVFGGIDGTCGLNTAIHCGLGSYTTIRDCTVLQLYGTNLNGYGIILNGHGQIVDNCRFFCGITGQGRHAVYVTDTPSSITVQNCYMEGFQHDGLTSNPANNQGSNIRIVGNRIVCCNKADTNAAAAALAMCVMDGLVVEGNVIEGSAAQGMIVTGCTRIRVAGNTIKGATYHGLWVTNSDGVIVNNDVYTNPAAPNAYGCIQVISSRVLVAGNRCWGTNARFGVRADTTTPIRAVRAFDNDVGALSYENFTDPAVVAAGCVIR